MRQWLKLLFAFSFVCLLFAFSTHNGSRDRERGRGRRAGESPSVEAPLVIAMCESLEAAMGEGDTMAGIVDKADSDDRAAFQLRGSWIRQRDQVTTLLKTLLLFSESPVWRIVVLTDSNATFNKITQISDTFPAHHRKRLLLERHAQWYPETHPELTDNWRPCAWAKQFLAEALPNEDAVIYVDTDVAFLGPAEEMWDVLESMGPQEVVALSAEPHYLFDKPQRLTAGAVGLNTGVMVANLTRQRHLLGGGGLGSAMIREGLLARRLRHRHDQDALNHFLRSRPHLVREMSPRWNFLAGSCVHGAPYCADCASFGIVVLHGADATFYRPIDRKFLALYDTLLHASLHKEDAHHLLQKTQLRLQILDNLHLLDYPCHDYPLFNHAATRGLVRLTH